jgi:thiol-disulfide isomerase/thioredoxin
MGEHSDVIIYVSLNKELPYLKEKRQSKAAFLTSAFYMFKTRIKIFFIILVVSAAMLSLIPFISRKIYYITLFSFIGYFYLTLFSFKVFGKKLPAISIAAIIFATMLLLQSFTIYTWFVWDGYGMPVVAAYCLAVISAYFYFKNKPPKNLIFFTLSACFVVFMFFQGWNYWLHRINYGTFTGKVETSVLAVKFEAFDQNSNLISDSDFKGKIVLLDFWHTRCGICFEKFPQVQAAFEKYKNDSSVAIYAVDKPIEEDKPNQAFEMIREEGYSFPVVIAKDEDFPEKFGVKYYPTTFVIDRSGMIVYKGDIAGAVKMVEEIKRDPSL